MVLMGFFRGLSGVLVGFFCGFYNDFGFRSSGLWGFELQGSRAYESMGLGCSE